MALPSHQSWVGQVALLAKHAKSVRHGSLVAMKSPHGSSWVMSGSSATLAGTLGSQEFSLKVCKLNTWLPYAQSAL